MQGKKRPLKCRRILCNKYYAGVRTSEQPQLQQPETLLPITAEEPVLFLHLIHVCTSTHRTTHVHTKALQLRPIWAQTRWSARRRCAVTHRTPPERHDQLSLPPWQRKESTLWHQFNWEVSENTQPFSVALSLNWLRLQSLPNPTPDVTRPAARGCIPITAHNEAEIFADHLSQEATGDRRRGEGWKGGREREGGKEESIKKKKKRNKQERKMNV